ncbi:pumilio domain-containing protein c [Histoplasma capsulatum var. duboisii H88]|uniref:Pumilio domain-containing protein c n=1 Tax=Ajellomyces capsulatus (strain H88) TaxID=544711 RepID=F0UNC3_AJEC8|nr:pumilio domain-containing protein c [Histoplasma capsulatum var. duboisii H88]QSS53746.1 pumilio domain-containing protein c [Histoplasma capsulatum var. duboisii H88]
MAPSSRPDGHLNLNYLPASQPMSGTSTGSSSPNEQPGSNSMKSSFGSSNGLNNAGGPLGNARIGAGSPSHDLGARLFSKRAREIQAQEGLAPNIWGPPTSGNSTPLRENIPESPSQDEFPDLVSAPEGNLTSPARRTRAGTVPSRFSPVGTLNGVGAQSFTSKTSRPTPSTSPFRPPAVAGIDSSSRPSGAGSGNNTTLLSRLRAGSMPQRTSVLGGSNPFGPSLFSTNWSSGRERATTLTSIRSSEGPTSPAQSSFSRDGLADADVKTLDYLGLAETPQQARAQLVRPSVDQLMQQQQQQQQQTSTLPPLLADLVMMNKNSNRFRSYSVNAKEKYAEDDEDHYGLPYAGVPSGTLTPSAAATAAQLAATQAQIHQHNLAVQAFANHASASRPRARTAGVLDTPAQRSSIRNYLATPSRLDNSLSIADLQISETAEYDDLPEAVQMLQLGGMQSLRQGQEILDETNLDGPTRALWIGSIPVSTTVTSLDAIFNVYGKIESTRVLTHKNCGFVNFERVESAIQAKSLLNGKEIFPGAGPVRIGYAKVPGTSGTGTPGQNGDHQSPTPDPTSSGLGRGGNNPDVQDGTSGTDTANGPGPNIPTIPQLAELQPEMTQIVAEFDTSEGECQSITESIQRAVAFKSFVDEIPPIPEPSQTRVYDAPRLRDIRKRIDNGTLAVNETEETANGMLPEIAELSSDYLGNTVVQKLFEYCSEPTKEKMLAEIAPHLAEIGVHKNGTWAAQKIIDVAKDPKQKQMIVESLRPYTVPLFLDQYGNYVLQCCLRFGPPYTDFIFESMLSRMWEIAQGRFGARAMRACLESHHATKDQQRMLAAAIALHSVQLATNANGALLLTWFLDTCTFPCRRTVLAPRLVPHLVHLCTHKVAYLTVLKVINQRNEPEARETVLKALFYSPGDETLEQILSDQTSGATFIFKVLTTPFFDESMRAEVVQTVAKVLTKLKTTPSQGYKRLMDEVGLSSRGGGSSRDNHHSRENQNAHNSNNEKNQRRPSSSRQANANSYTSQSQPERQFGGQFAPVLQPQSFDSPTAMARSISSEQSLPPYDVYGMTAMNGVNGLMNLSSMSNNPGYPQEPILPINQLQYQTFLASQTRGMSPGGFYVPQMAGATFNGFPSAPTALDSFRALQPHSSPLSGPPPQISSSPMLHQPPFAPPQFTAAVNNTHMYPSYPQQSYQSHAIQVPPPGGRRGRR